MLAKLPLNSPRAFAVLQVKLKLPWMHAQDHQMDCQVKHSGLYAVRGCAATCSRCAVLWAAAMALEGTIRMLYKADPPPPTPPPHPHPTYHHSASPSPLTLHLSYCRNSQVHALASRLSSCGPSPRSSASWHAT